MPRVRARLISPDLNARFQQFATAKGKATVLQTQSHCTLHDLLTFGNVNLLSTEFQSLGNGLLTNPVVAKYLALGNLGSNRTAQLWCQYGSKIMFTTRDGGTDHVATQLLYGPGAIMWLDSALKSHSPLITSCSFLTEGSAP
ncbi:BQ2448_5586 [Microbotryum intermedium]|uniref:BQ2448_5586 protein n=1 Tax=Microbotryum intermedium TaxID=269621 RepID=A0A238EYH7_9BASI|nr:BQ2448_5586 [Microbotryum intermedium]